MTDTTITNEPNAESDATFDQGGPTNWPRLRRAMPGLPVRTADWRDRRATIRRMSVVPRHDVSATGVRRIDRASARTAGLTSDSPTAQSG